jgi:hypothetical protein
MAHIENNAPSSSFVASDVQLCENLFPDPLQNSRQFFMSLPVPSLPFQPVGILPFLLLQEDMLMMSLIGLRSGT